ncbi:site-specific DNA methylase [Cenarchaeum symbiosum A]|uniref:Site-specific DNA methylase n=1 Tax=Cenarchaeum symbiosum (strain A) TaxID=414004 RepID=A0RZ57_CENSY|nr:site-specific DNA methylase [Cenarchaeum symbiosum A]
MTAEGMADSAADRKCKLKWNQDLFGKISVVPPLGYIRSRRQAVGHILPILQSIRHDEYREPMAGEGAVFFAKPWSANSVLNDLDEDLITTYRILRNASTRDELATAIAENPPVRGMIPDDGNDPATVARRRLSQSHIEHSSPEKMTPDKWKEMITMAGRKLEGTELTVSDFEDSIAEPGRNVLMFVDPPRYNPGGVFTEGDHSRLAGALRLAPHKFLLVCNDCPEVRKLYDWARVKEAALGAQTGELFISNFELPDRPCQDA